MELKNVIKWPRAGLAWARPEELHYMGLMLERILQKSIVEIPRGNQCAMLIATHIVLPRDEVFLCTQSERVRICLTCRRVLGPAMQAERYEAHWLRRSLTRRTPWGSMRTQAVASQRSAFARSIFHAEGDAEGARVPRKPEHRARVAGLHAQILDVFGIKEILHPHKGFPVLR